MCLFNNEKRIRQDRHNENYVDDDNKKDLIFGVVDKQKYEQAVSECKKLQTFIKQWLGGTLKSFQNKSITISGMNRGGLLMLLKFQMVMMK